MPKQIAKFGFIVLFTLLIVNLLYSQNFGHSGVAFGSCPQTGAATPSDFLRSGPDFLQGFSRSDPSEPSTQELNGIQQTSPPSYSNTSADVLQNLPATTREQLLNITNQTTLDSHLEKLQELIRFTIGNNDADFNLSSSGFSVVLSPAPITLESMGAGGDIHIYYYLSPVFVSPNNETYALLMLKFGEYNCVSEYSGKLTAIDTIDYNVKINGTNNFNFEENGTTDKEDVDIKIIRNISFTDALNSFGNYSMTIDILKLNQDPLYRLPISVSVNSTR